MEHGMIKNVQPDYWLGILVLAVLLEMLYSSVEC